MATSMDDDNQNASNIGNNEFDDNDDNWEDEEGVLISTPVLLKDILQSEEIRINEYKDQEFLLEIEDYEGNIEILDSLVDDICFHEEVRHFNLKQIIICQGLNQIRFIFKLHNNCHNHVYARKITPELVYEIVIQCKKLGYSLKDIFGARYIFKE